MQFRIENPGAYLRQKRKSLGMRLSDVANETNLSPGYISRLENGVSFPSLEALYKLTTTLNLDINDICAFEKISVDSDEPVEMDDILAKLKIKIDGEILRNKQKAVLLRLFRTVHAATWFDEFTKPNEVYDILAIVDEYKKSKLHER